MGRFLSVAGDKFYVRGVTYGAFRPDAHGDEYPAPATARRDLDLMVAHEINAVRTYTPPPPWFLDAAGERSLLVLPGMGAEGLVGHLNDGRRAQARVERQLAERVQRCAAHPALLGYSLANEIPAAVVRWLGPRRVEGFLRNLCARIKDVDPAGLVTYVNYPSTEYLELPFLDFVSFNVFLERQDRFAAYLYRLQNLAGDRPLLMTELGLDSMRNGEQGQARSLGWQLATAFETGCAGTFVYAWTDEWHRGGEDVRDWAFGLTDRERRPKPALAAVREAYAQVPLPADGNQPRMSVVVCAYNAEPTIGECLEATVKLDYPDYEVVVVDDGSTDRTAAIARNYPVRIVSTANHGLSSARNTGLAAADGEIVAYLDSDAYPDRDWLRYLAHGFSGPGVVAVGGPNLPPPGDGPIAECVARAPGGPAHVLLSDTLAEHLPGCNLAIRASALRSIGGFDPRFRAAGDDVDVCWRLRDDGGSLAFSPAALVWHHRRNSVRAYWRQQRGYGRAEALLEAKWPERYNAGGHFQWAGRIYDRGLTQHLLRRQRVYHGSWGSAPFQSLYRQSPGTLLALPLTPEWLLLTALLAVLTGAAAAWAPTPAILTLAMLSGTAALLVILQAIRSAARATFPEAPPRPGTVLGRRMLTAALHVLQPAARLLGRLGGGLTLWRRHRLRGFRPPLRRSGWDWSHRWVAPEERLRAVESGLRARGAVVRRGGDYDRWDLDVPGGPLGGARLLLAVEDVGGGAQLVRYRCWPVVRRVALVLTSGLGLASGIAWLGEAETAAVPAVAVVVLLAVLLLAESGAALGDVLEALPAGLGAVDEDRSRTGAGTYRREPSAAPVQQGERLTGEGRRSE